MNTRTNPIDFEIRAATVADIPAIVRVTNLAYGVEAFCIQGQRIDAGEVQARMGSGGFLVIDDALEAATLRASVYTSLIGGRGYLGILSVAPGHQGRGLARALIAAVEERCRRADCDFLDISVVNLRQELFPFYARQGFVATSILPFPSPDRCLQPLHLVQMTKALGPQEEP